MNSSYLAINKPTDSRRLMNLNRVNSKKSMPRHIIVKLLKSKDKVKILKAERKKQYLRGKIILMTEDFSPDTKEERRK